MSRNDVTPQKCGVRFEPPAIVLTYMTTKGKLHRRTMPLRNFTKNSGNGISRFADELKKSKRHEKYLEKIPTHQLERLITIIRDHINGISLEESLKKNKELDKIDPEEDLNKVDAEILKHKKAVMDEGFERNRKKPGDPDFKYDVEVDFEQAGNIESCDWDSGSDDEF